MRTDEHELELSWDDETDRGRHRRRRGGSADRGSTERGRGGRTAIALLLTLVILGLLGGGAWYGFEKASDYFSTPDYNSGGTGEVQFEVKAGSTAAQIGQQLTAADIVKSQKAFVEAAKRNARSKDIQPGFYKLRQKMRAADALSLLLDLNNKVQSKVTIPEGKTTFEIYEILAKATDLPVADFKEAAKDPKALGIPDFWFSRFDKKESAKGVEGFLFPETYQFNPGVTAQQVLKEMVSHFLKVAADVGFVKKLEAAGNKFSPYEALILASLSQAEAGIAEDLGKICRVGYNRILVKKMPLEYDVTTNYWLQLQGKPKKASKDLTDGEMLDPKNNYSTHGEKLGLPPGPINSPGKAALAAAVEPTPGDWLFFVAIDKTGRSAFATTVAEHDKNVAIAKKNGVL